MWSCIWRCSATWWPCLMKEDKSPKTHVPNRSHKAGGEGTTDPEAGCGEGLHHPVQEKERAPPFMWHPRGKPSLP